MKYERDAITKNGRRTWKVTYELVRGPEPKPKHGDAKTAPTQTPKKAERSAAKRSLPSKSQSEKFAPSKRHTKKRRANDDGPQLGMF